MKDLIQNDKTTKYLVMQSLPDTATPWKHCYLDSVKKRLFFTKNIYRSKLVLILHC